MDPRLLEACMSGDEQALQALIRHDRLILYRAVTCCEETPLHVAVLLRHVSFVRALLGLKPELVSERDATGSVPLHLASAEGSAEVVSELLRVDAELCSARDHGGRTPLHLGVMKGRLDVVGEFIRVCPQSASEMLDRGETIFHLAIMYCRLEVLKLLVELLKDDPRQLLVATDDRGNTVLHFAALFKQIETVKYLVSLEEVKAIANDPNGNGHTALDEIMEKSPRDFNCFEIVEILTQVGIQRGRCQSTTVVVRSPPSTSNSPTISLHSPPRTTTNSVHADTSIQSQIKRWVCQVGEYLMLKYRMEWIADAHGNLMVVATVIASIAFQAGINPPGGVWQADTMDKHNCTKPDMCRAGTAVFKDVEGFDYFYSSNTWALLTAVGVVLLYFGGFSLKNIVGTWILSLTTCVMLDNILAAYIYSTSMVVRPFRENTTLFRISVVWEFLVMLIVSIHTTRIWYWLIYNKVMSFVSPRSMLCRHRPVRILAFWVGTLATVSGIMYLMGYIYAPYVSGFTVGVLVIVQDTNGVVLTE